MVPTKRAPFFAWAVSSVTHPHVSPSVLLLSLYAPQHRGNATSASWRIPEICSAHSIETCAPNEAGIPGVEAVSVTAISDVDSFLPSYRMRVDSL